MPDLPPAVFGSGFFSFLVFGNNSTCSTQIPLSGIPTEQAATHLAVAKQPTPGSQEAEREVDLVSDPGHGGFGVIFAGGKDPDTQVGGPVTIKEVITGSPAAAQGLAPGQEVVSINGHPVSDVTLDKATAMLTYAKVSDRCVSEE